jgi:TPR repeat protein
MFYLSGEVEEKSVKEGMYWLTVAARMGFFHSIFNLALIHKNGDFGNEVDLEEAETLLEACCKIDPTNQLSAELLVETRFMRKG